MRKGAVKSFHKKVIKILQKMNENIKNDDVWLGRFEVREKQQFYARFEDGSGYQAWYVIEVFDKKTGQSFAKLLDTHFGIYTNDAEDAHLEYHNRIALRFFASHLWEMVNNFIIDMVKVWDEDPSPYKARVNYCPKVRKPRYVIPNGILSNI